MAAAATAVVVVVLVVIVALRGGDDGGGAAGPAPPTRSTPSCGSGDLVAAGHATDTTGATAYLTVTLELPADAEPCTVENHPDVVVLDDGAPTDVATVADADLGEPRELVVLPGRPVLVTLGWAVTGYCDDIDNDGNLLAIAPGLEIEVPGFGPTSCGPGADALPPMRVGPFTYVDPRSSDGTVTGVVGLNGGPGPGTGEFVTRGRIEFDGVDETYGATVGLDGKYEVELPAGTYRVRVSTLQYRAGEPYDHGTFDVVGGELNELNVILPVR